MSHHQKYAWASLGAALLIWLYFASRMTDGGSVVDVAARHMIFSYVAMIVMMVVAHSLIAVALAAWRRDATVRDERDLAIEAQAERIEGWVVAAAVNLIVIQVLAEAAYPGHILPRFDLSAVPALVLALITSLFAGHVAKQVATLWLYRA